MIVSFSFYLTSQFFVFIIGYAVFFGLLDWDFNKVDVAYYPKRSFEKY